MAVLIEATSVIIKRAVIDEKFPNGWDGFKADAPNRTLCTDNELVRVGFMNPDDVQSYIQHLEQYGICYLGKGTAQDIIVVDQRTGFLVSCDWAEVGDVYLNDDPNMKITACRSKGSALDACILPKSWKYKGSLSETFSFTPREQLEKSLTFLRHEDGLDVYLNTLTGKESYAGRPRLTHELQSGTPDRNSDGEKEKSSFNIKKALKRDFDIDVHISTGLGQSLEDPIIILDVSPDAAAITVMEVLRGLALGRKVIWKVLLRTLINHGGKTLEKIKIESKNFTNTEVETITSSFYFDIGLSMTGGENLPNAIAYTEGETGISIPFEIGYLHFTKLTNNEVHNAGLGISLAFSAPEIKATIYIYDRNITGIPSDFSSSIVRKEHQQCTDDFWAANPNAIVTKEASFNAASITEFFVLDDSYKQNSVVTLTVVNGKFVKLRMTSLHDPELNKLVMESFNIFQNIIGRLRSIIH